MADIAEPRTDQIIEPEQLTRLLELELTHKRATWKKASARNRSIRAFGFFFLFLLIMGCLVGGYIAFTRATETRPPQNSNSAVQR